MTELERRKHPDWCSYPVTGEGRPQIDMCWSFMSNNEITKEYCESCEFCSVETIDKSPILGLEEK